MLKDIENVCNPKTNVCDQHANKWAFQDLNPGPPATYGVSLSTSPGSR